jgi:hypothetical protein
MVAIHYVETRSDQNDLKNQNRFRLVEQCISNHGAWLAGELEEELDSSRRVLVFGSM